MSGQKLFYLKISGSAWGIEAPTAKDAIEQIRDHAGCYCTITALEIGVDCDENGYAISSSAETYTSPADVELQLNVDRKLELFKKLGIK